MYEVIWTTRGVTGVERARTLLLCALIANVPDLDFLVSYLVFGRAHEVHGELTHTVPFAVLGGLALAPFRAFGRPGRTFLVALVVLLSHVLMDFATGKKIGFSQGYGVMLLYPFSTERLSLPVKLFLGPRHRTLHALVTWDNVLVVLYEVAVLGPLLALASIRSRRTAPD